VPPSPTGLVINEIDYDQVGTDSAEFVELENTSAGTLDLTGTDLVFVNGNNGAVYRTIDLGAVGSVAPGAYVVVGDPSVVAALPPGVASIEMTGVDNIQNGAPDAVTILDTNHTSILDSLSYEGSVLDAALPGFADPVVLDEGYPHSDPVGPVDSNVDPASLARVPDGSDTDDARVDWVLSSTPTPGAANVG
jgi:vibriolysin